MVDAAPIRVNLKHESALYRLIAATPIRERAWLVRRMVDGYIELRSTGLHHHARALSYQTPLDGVKPMPRLLVTLKRSEHAALEHHLRDTPPDRWGSELRFMAEDYLAFITSTRPVQLAAPVAVPLISAGAATDVDRPQLDDTDGSIVEKAGGFGLDGLSFGA